MCKNMAAKLAFMGACALPALMVSSGALAQIKSGQTRPKPGGGSMARTLKSVLRPSGRRSNGPTPLLHESAKLTASDASPSDIFGTSVSISGDTVIVGAPEYEFTNGNSGGAAYIFRFTGTAWIEEQRLTASDAAPDDQFGISVSVNGDTALVGAPGDECAFGESCGAAYVFRFDGNVWVEEQKLTEIFQWPRDRFGSAVSLSGDLAAVAGPNALCEMSSFEQCGTTSIYRFNGIEWAHEQRLRASDEEPDNQYGRSPSLSGDMVVVGAWLDDCAAGIDCGSAYVHRLDGADWVEEQKLTASDAGRDDLFGANVSTNGEWAVAGAHWDDCKGTCCAPTAAPGCDDAGIEACVCAHISSCCSTEWSPVCTDAIERFDCGTCGYDCGSAYVFRFNGSDWVEEEQLIASDAAPDAWFGESVAISDHWIVVTSPSGQTKFRGAYAYRLSGASWVETYRLTGSDTQVGDRLGGSVSISGGTAIVGACLDDCEAGASCGSAYVFRLASPSDLDLDGDVDMIDYSLFLERYTGDLLEFVSFQSEFTGPT